MQRIARAMMPRQISSFTSTTLRFFSPPTPPLSSFSVNSRVSFSSRNSRPMSTSTTTIADTPEKATATPATTEQLQSSDSDPIVQYVVLRRDLIDTWPFGSIVTQGCHASVAAIWTYREHPETAAYCSSSNLDSMHKVTLEVKGEQQVMNLSVKLTAGGIEYKMWIEQPENVPTCIATRPYRKSQVGSFFKKLKLCKLKLCSERSLCQSLTSYKLQF